MLRLFKNKLFLLAAVTVLIFVVMALSSMNNKTVNAFANVVSVPFSPLQKMLSAAGQKIDSFFSYFNDIKQLKEENKELKIKVSELEKENRELTGYKDKIKELRDALNLKDRFDNYDFIGANVIAKDAGNWFNVFKVDIGMKDAIEQNAPVLTSNRGLVGRVLNVDLTTSKIISIIDEDSVVSARLVKSGGYIIVKGDLALKEKGLCRIDYIPLDVDVTVGDVVETSGLGGIYPKGILIGTVKEVRKTENDLNRYAIIEPEVNFKKLDEVFLLRNRSK